MRGRIVLGKSSPLVAGALVVPASFGVIGSPSNTSARVPIGSAACSGTSLEVVGRSATSRDTKSGVQPARAYS